jgi:hypothetical protein
MSTQESGGGGINPGAYSLIGVTGTAPAGAAHVRVSILYSTGSSSARAGRADLVLWNLETPSAVSNFIYEAVQSASATSGSTEPAWPTTEGDTIIDGGVTWEAIGTSIITWQAVPIMLSGGTAVIATLGALTAGSGYVNGTYSFVPLTGGTGAGAQANITVTGNEVTTVTLTNGGNGYAVGDTLSAAVANIGGSGTGFQILVATVSGTSGEPTFPTGIGESVSDPSTFTDINGAVENTSMSWVAIDRHIADANDPNTNAVLIAATHVFAANNDIVSYSAAVNPVDWTSANNAGYLPTGLNNYGDNPVKVLALYRSNLMAFNAGGYQMWQLDPDPANMALLDAQPVGSIYTRAAQAVANDLLFLAEVGVRNIGTTGAQANMQVGNLGQPVDPLVVVQLAADTYDPISLYYPGRGQYWLIFGPQAFVLTINGTGQKTWSRYVFPDIITDWTINGTKLYLRSAGNLVWQLDAATLVDDAGLGPIATFANICGGAAYTDGTYDAVALTGGHGSGATANIVVAGAVVTTVTLADAGTGYVVSDVLSAAAADLGGTGANFAVSVATVTGSDGENVAFPGLLQWPYVDFGNLGVNKMLIGLDLVGTGAVTIQIGFNERDPTTFSDNPGFSTSLNVTPPYTISAEDTLPDQPIPIPLNAPSFTLILSFAGNQAWQWDASNMYINDQRGPGSWQ